MSQNSIMLYFVLVLFIFLSFNSLNSFYKFFFISEIMWILLFLIFLTTEIMSNTNSLNMNVLFILVFTAVEALVVASIFLLNSKNFSFKI